MCGKITELLRNLERIEQRLEKALANKSQVKTLQGVPIERIKETLEVGFMLRSTRSWGFPWLGGCK